MTSRSRQKVPVPMSEAKRVKIYPPPRFSFWTGANLTPKEDFEQLFNYQGPIISECTIIGLAQGRWRVCACLINNSLPFTGEQRKLAISTSLRSQAKRQHFRLPLPLMTLPQTLRPQVAESWQDAFVKDRLDVA